jgi:hypothetical protein
MSTSVKISSDLAGKPVDPSLYKSIDVNFNCTLKCKNSLQLIDCKCEVDPTGNCVFEEQFGF